MRDGTTQQVLDILAASGITTALLVRMDFKSETIFVWTGQDAITVQGTGDSLLDGNTFESFAEGVVLGISDNAFSYSGAEAMTLSVAIPSNPSPALTNAAVFPEEFQGRNVTVWRSLMIQPSDPLAAPGWLFRRTRAGAMDKIEVTNDGTSHQFSLTIEAHASTISNATNATYLDQQTRYDPADTSQRYAASIAQGGQGPGQNASGYGGGFVGGSTPFGLPRGYFENIALQ